MESTGMWSLGDFLFFTLVYSSLCLGNMPFYIIIYSIVLLVK
jgi:hypothetical protein